jgi:hypothetical protein
MAAATLGAATATGLGAQLGVIDTSGVRWVHHGLYAASVTACVVAALVDVVGAGATRGVMAASLVTLGVLARTRGGSARHALLGAVATSGAGLDLLRVR